MKGENVRIKNNPESPRQDEKLISKGVTDEG
jgi:hypothetical protein